MLRAKILTLHSWEKKKEKETQLQGNIIGNIYSPCKKKRKKKPSWRLQRALDVDHEAVLHVLVNEPLEGLVDALNPDDFHVRVDLVGGAEVDHLLGHCNSPGYAPGDGLPPCNSRGPPREE